MKWKWLISLYYNDTVRPPKVPGELAIQVKLTNDASKDMEVSAAKSRTDIGEIVVREL